MPEQPQRRISLELTWHADDKKALIGALNHIIFLISSDQMGPSGVSGGFSDGGTYRYTERPDVTHESYIDALNAYLKAKRAQPESK